MSVHAALRFAALSVGYRCRKVVAFCNAAKSSSSSSYYCLLLHRRKDDRFCWNIRVLPLVFRLLKCRPSNFCERWLPRTPRNQTQEVVVFFCDVILIEGTLDERQVLGDSRRGGGSGCLGILSRQSLGVDVSFLIRPDRTPIRRKPERRAGIFQREGTRRFSLDVASQAIAATEC